MDKKVVKKLTIGALVIILVCSYCAHTGYRICTCSKRNEGLRIGYFPNINHAQAVIGFGSGEFQKELGSSIQGTAVHIQRRFISYSSSFSK